MTESRAYIAERRVVVEGTDLIWTGLGQWIDRVLDIGAQIRPAATHYRRCRLLFDSLLDRDISMTFNDNALRRAEALLDSERRGGVLFHGPFREWSRAELARRLQLVRARRAALQLGRGVSPKIKGPRFDPRLLPDDRLDSLIQRHADISVVDMLRSEKRRRETDSSAASRTCH